MAQGGNGETFSTSPVNVLRCFMTKLTSIISMNPVAIAVELCEEGVISFEILDRVQTTSAPSKEHATTIMTAVYKKVEAVGDEALGTFLEVLKKRPECVGITISIERQRHRRGPCKWFLVL